jgi:hypothetical protein
MYIDSISERYLPQPNQHTRYHSSPLPLRLATKLDPDQRSAAQLRDMDRNEGCSHASLASQGTARQQEVSEQPRRRRHPCSTGRHPTQRRGRSASLLHTVVRDSLVKWIQTCLPDAMVGIEAELPTADESEIGNIEADLGHTGSIPESGSTLTDSVVAGAVVCFPSGGSAGETISAATMLPNSAHSAKQIRWRSVATRSGLRTVHSFERLACHRPRVSSIDRSSAHQDVHPAQIPALGHQSTHRNALT